MNDDLSELLGIKYSPEQAQALAELARRKNDRIRVQNLLDTDYYVEWALHDEKEPGGRFLVPGRNRDIGYGLGQSVHPRYIAFKFFKELSNIILSAEMKKKVDEENSNREARGVKKMDKTFETGEELHFVQPYLPNNPDKLMELLPKIILGVEEEWGMEPIPYKAHDDKVKWDEVMAIVNRPTRKIVQPENAAAAPLSSTPAVEPEPPYTPPAQEIAQPQDIPNQEVVA